MSVENNSPITLLSVHVTQMISHIFCSVTASQNAPILECSVALLLHFQEGLILATNYPNSHKEIGPKNVKQLTEEK